MAKNTGPGGAGRVNPRGKNSPGGLPNEGPGGAGKGDAPAAVRMTEAQLTKKEQEHLDNWLTRQEQRALGGTGLLAGPEMGMGALTDLLKSNRDLATRVRDWMKEMSPRPDLPGLSEVAPFKTELLKAFPELYDQYIAATGQSLIRDAEGNPVRVFRSDELFGMREGDQVYEPPLYGAEGETVERPTFPDEGVVGSEAANQFLAARAARLQAETGGESPYFSLDELQGGEQ